MVLSKIISASSSQKLINTLPLTKIILSQYYSKQYSISSINNKILSNKKINIELQKNQLIKTVKANYNAKPLHQHIQIKNEEDIDFYKGLAGKTGGEIIIEMLQRLGVDTIFGYPGGYALPIIDSMNKYRDIRYIVPRHEQGAGHMAEGYAKSTGKVGVVIVTSGPGATNIITPLADALNDGIPLVAFSAQVPTYAVGTDAFQEADMVGISRSCTKWNCIIKDIKELPRRIEEAFKIATTGRPGPVLLDIPKDISAGKLTKELEKFYGLNFPPCEPYLFSDNPEGELRKSIHHAARMINNAERPVIIAGAGIFNHPSGPKALKALSRKANIPVATSFQGIGCFNENDPMALHMIGMHGSVYGNLAIQAADVVIVLGSRMDERATANTDLYCIGARKAEKRGYGGIIQFEIQPKNINKKVQVTEAVEGDVTENIIRMLPLIQSHPHKQWNNQIQKWKKKYAFTYDRAIQNQEIIKPQHVIEELNRLTERIKRNIIITTGVGQHQMWAAQFFRWKYPKSLISSGALGTMGFGVPAALGVKLGNPEKMVIDIDGDSSFSMTGQELATAKQYNIPIKVIIMNNSAQGMVRQMQEKYYEERYSQTIMVNPDFDKLCKAMGCETIHTSNKASLTKDLKKFIAFNHPTQSIVLIVDVDQGEIVYPVVGANDGLHEMDLGNLYNLNEPNYEEKYF
ncbi:acetolactate synthase [Neocallimastix californiae]|jgi:acetolactate synthase-1/2/3 large subunit|uniref:Acetolactate synthase n=1 Tax=Neocallimastix californiae TaxID=1754190 RepID=A0A1Y2ATI0_9FUNG|nr:acetolactate synthase [Neocallimastix californiae]|eukprot:ORY25600.1 acetolactate synthase [Neocallimastix californiae]